MGNRLETRMCVCTSQSRGPTIIHSSACLHDEGEGGTRGNPFGSVRFIWEEGGGGIDPAERLASMHCSFEWQMAKFRPPEFFFSPIPSRRCIFFPSLFPSPSSFLLVFGRARFLFFLFFFFFNNIPPVSLAESFDSFVTGNSLRDKWTEGKIFCRDWNSFLLLSPYLQFFV